MFQLTINEELYLRMLTGRDAEDLFRLTDESRDYLKEWLPWVDKTQSVEDSLQFIKQTLLEYEDKSSLTAGIFYRDHLVGVLGFNMISAINHNGEIGYWLSENYQGKGIMIKAVEEMCGYGFNQLKLNRIVIQCATENKKSQAIPERLGFQKEGCLREAGFLYDRYVDHYIYGMLAAEWGLLSTEKSDN